MSGQLIVENLGKSYRTYRSEWQRVAGWFGWDLRAAREKWVLRDVSFRVEPGEALGIIGQNGAGKSTLLKLITGTLRPSTGRVMVSGRVSAILELGMGFNPEFTGRQNAALAARLMGFANQQIDAAMPGIKDFSEVGDAFDDPVRTYSSGMQMRVAFAVATAFRPDVLIVDEALSVGDAYFQHKSFDRIRSFKAEGTTLLFVSHNIGDVRVLCDRALLLSGGGVIKDGPPDEVADYYNALIAIKDSERQQVEQRRGDQGWLVTRSGSHEAVVTRLGLEDPSNGQPLSALQVGQTARLVAEIEVREPVEKLVFGVLIRDRSGHDVWGSNTQFTRQAINAPDGGSQWLIHFEFECYLGAGTFSVSTALADSDSHTSRNFEWIDNMLLFEVVNLDKARFVGTTYLPGSFSVIGPHGVENG